MRTGFNCRTHLQTYQGRHRSEQLCRQEIFERSMFQSDSDGKSILTFRRHFIPYSDAYLLHNWWHKTDVCSRWTMKGTCLLILSSSFPLFHCHLPCSSPRICFICMYLHLSRYLLCRLHVGLHVILSYGFFLLGDVKSGGEPSCTIGNVKCLGTFCKWSVHKATASSC